MKSLSQRAPAPEPQSRDLPRAAEMAVAEERSRLAREIHDSLAQAFVSIIFQADHLEFSLGANHTQVKDALERIQELARSGLDESRRAVRALRPQALEGRTLPAAMERAIKELSRDFGLSGEFRVLGRTRDLAPQVEDELFRIAQEAMNNAKKHARARRVTVLLDYRSGHVALTVRDDGAGFAAPEIPVQRPGHGLTIMRERAQRIGGRLVIESPATGGTAVRVQVPAKPMRPRLGERPLFPAGRDRAASRLKHAQCES